MHEWPKVLVMVTRIEFWTGPCPVDALHQLKWAALTELNPHLLKFQSTHWDVHMNEMCKKAHTMHMHWRSIYPLCDDWIFSLKKGECWQWKITLVANKCLYNSDKLRHSERRINHSLTDEVLPGPVPQMSRMICAGTEITQAWQWERGTSCHCLLLLLVYLLRFHLLSVYQTVTTCACVCVCETLSKDIHAISSDAWNIPFRLHEPI